MRMIRTMAIAAGLAIMLAGCNAKDPAAAGDPASQLSSNPTIASIQQYAIKACSFLPAATMIGNILASGNAAVATGTQIASAICDAVQRKSAGRGGVVKVYGVPLKGKRVIR